ncbi:Methyl-CpG-binding domain protein 1 [Anabarilius grahami]|uniref:Methyl-CpG-binding domain protein 1 n=1 Tax=Anabarilius grahami TaxID=495550 RepID=A0A3N0YQB6_ANAGA|nr:Methyl-CpG-binding domain protein 1 [Anabarilius grahami]
MTDELNRASSEPETTNPEETMHPIEADINAVEENTVWDDMPGKVTVELPPDWLKPMEEDEDDGVDGLRSSERITRRNNDGVPKVKRRRGRPPIARNVRQGLNRLDFKKGLHMDRTRRTKNARSLLDSRRSGLSSGNATPVPDPSRTPEVLPRTPQSIIHSLTSTPQRPRLTPSSISNTPNTEFNSPPRLTRISPLNIDTSGTRNFIHTPSVKLGNVSQQIISSSSEPGKAGTELPLRLWLYPSMEPISPTKTQDTLISDLPVNSPDFPEITLKGTMSLKESHPMLSKCENCGSPFSAQKAGDTLCYTCRPKLQSNFKMFSCAAEKKHSPPNIVFRKDFVPDGGDDDDWAQKKRNRRMCRQCDACLREEDCGKCDFCMDKPKYGGSNKKRQKCRLRQCKFQSKLHSQTAKARGRRKWNYSFKEEDDDMFIEAVLEDDEPSNIEEDPVVLGNEGSVMASNEMYSNTSGLSAHQGLYYNMPGMPVPSHMLGSGPLCNNNPVPLGEVIGSLPMGDDVTQNGFLQIEMVRVGSPPSHFTEEPVSEPQLEPTPVITQIFSLAGAESDCDRDQGLMELFTSLGQTVLPPHWVCVMAKGPVLQLLQCSKLSTMADTIVQIEKGFFFQVSVQNQPLLLMHAIYSRHPTCLETVDDVVSVLLDLEGLGVCQGYQSLDMGSPWEPRMCVRAALCDLLISKDEEHCMKCTQPVEG